MATPTLTITGVPASPVAPGSTTVLTAVVTDADNRTVTLSFTVTDSTGASSAPQTVTFPIGDTFNVTGSIVSGGGTLTKTDATHFSYVA